MIELLAAALLLSLQSAPPAAAVPAARPSPGALHATVLASPSAAGGALAGAASSTDERARTLGPTGRRMFAVQLDPAPGLRGRFGFATTTSGFVDPLVLRLRDASGEIALRSDGMQWFPSHLEARWTGGGLAVVEQKFITAGDELVDRVTLTNLADAPRDIAVLLSGAMTPLLDRFRSRQLQVDLSGLPHRPIELPLAAGPLQYDGVQYALGDTQEFVVLVPGEGVSITLPEVRPARAVVHLLARGPLTARWHFDDGSSETVAWFDDEPVGRVDWHRLGPPQLAQLSYEPPPGRFAQRLELDAQATAAVPCAVTVELLPVTGRLPVLFGQPDFHGLPVFLALAGEGFTSAQPGDDGRSLLRSLALPPAGSVSFHVLVAAGQRAFATALAALGRSEDPHLFDEHVAAYERWFAEQTPEFHCSDTRLEQNWRYRWYVLRHDMLELDLPEFPLPVCYAGLADAEHTQVSPAASHVLAELRWLRDPSFVQGQLRALLMPPSPDGRLAPVRLGERLAPVPHQLATAVLDAYRVNGSRALVDECLPLLRRDLAATLRAQPDADVAAAARALDLLDGSAQDAALTGDTPPTDAGRATDDAAWQALLAATERHWQDGELLLHGADGCVDGLHDAYNDGLIRSVAGLVPRLDAAIELRPRIGQLEWFRFTGLPSHGRLLDIAWDRPDGSRRWDDLPEGYSLVVDGELRFHSEQLRDVVVE